MAFYDKFPYTNFQELNLDWLIRKVIEVQKGLDFVIENASLKYADPIQWSITTQYQANTVVIDPSTGIAYLSTQPVPVNILITDTNYWTPIFDLSSMFNELEDDITDLDNRTTTNTADIATLQTNILYGVPENALLHGVVGNGITDDTAAIQAVINNYPWVYFPPGYYLISQTITIPQRHKISGRGNSVFVCGSDNMLMFQMDRQAAIEDLRINGNNGTMSADVIIHVIERNCAIDRITTDGGKTAVRIGNSTADTNCLFMNDSTLNNYTVNGLEFWKSNDCYFTNVLTNANNATATGCLMTQNLYCEGHAFTNCSFLMGERSLMILQQTVRFCRFVNCYFDSAQQVFLNAGDAISFSNCWFSNRGGNGVLMGNTTNIMFNGCTFKNCDQNGLHVTGTCHGTIVNGCTFNRNANVGIMCSTNEIVVTNNLFNNLGTTGPTMTAGIGGTPVSGIFTGNVFTGITSGLPTPSTNVIVDNNVTN